MGILLTIAAIVAATAIGVAAEGRWGGRAVSWARAALGISLYTLLPFVTFLNLAGLELDGDLGVGIALGWIALGLTALLAWLIGRRLGLAPPALGALIVASIIANTGFLGYPLCAALLGFDSLGEAIAYDILVTVAALLLVGFALGAAFGERAGDTPRERMRAFFTRNPPLYAAIAALIAPDALAPEGLVDFSRYTVIALLPIGFFAVGTILAAEAEEGHFTLGSPLRPPLSVALGLRLIVAPGLLYLMALPLIDLPGPYLLLAAMPVGINTLVIAHVYGLDLRLSAQAVAWSTAITIAGALASLAL